MRKTKIEDLRPYAKVIFNPDTGSADVEDNFPDTYEGRAMVANVLYGAFQAVALDMERMKPQIEIPTPEQVSQLHIVKN
jgi:hypothetical protein